MLTRFVPRGHWSHPRHLKNYTFEMQNKRSTNVKETRETDDEENFARLLLSRYYRTSRFKCLIRFLRFHRKPEFYISPDEYRVFLKSRNNVTSKQFHWNYCYFE